MSAKRKDQKSKLDRADLSDLVRDANRSLSDSYLAKNVHTFLAIGERFKELKTLLSRMSEILSRVGQDEIIRSERRKMKQRLRDLLNIERAFQRGDDLSISFLEDLRVRLEIELTANESSLRILDYLIRTQAPALKVAK